MNQLQKTVKVTVVVSLSLYTEMLSCLLTDALNNNSQSVHRCLEEYMDVHALLC